MMATTMRSILRLWPPSLQRSYSGRLSACSLSRPLQLVDFHLRSTFTTSSCQWATKKSRLSQNVSRPPLKSVLPYKSPFNAYAEQLANRASPTLLYEASSNAFYKNGWLVLGSFCLTWAIINFKNQILHPLEVEPIYIRYITGAACVGMLVGAGWSFLKVSLSSLNKRAYVN